MLSGVDVVLALRLLRLSSEGKRKAVNLTRLKNLNGNGKLRLGEMLMYDITFISIVMVALVFLMLWNLHDSR